MDRRFTSGLRPANRLAINGHVEPVERPADPLHPADEAGLKHAGVEETEYAAEGVVGRDAVGKGQELP